MFHFQLANVKQPVSNCVITHSLFSDQFKAKLKPKHICAKTEKTTVNKSYVRAFIIFAKFM